MQKIHSEVSKITNYQMRVASPCLGSPGEEPQTATVNSWEPLSGRPKIPLPGIKFGMQCIFPHQIWDNIALYKRHSNTRHCFNTKQVQALLQNHHISTGSRPK